MFKGVTSEGINREVSSILECARLNQMQNVQSLAIPETSLLFLARDQLGLLRIKGNEKNCGGFQPDSMSILRGILPSLQYVVHRHGMTEDASKSWEKEGKHLKVSIDSKPNTAQNPGTLQKCIHIFIDDSFAPHTCKHLIFVAERHSYYRFVFFGSTWKWRFHLQVLL